MNCNEPFSLCIIHSTFLIPGESIKLAEFRSHAWVCCTKAVRGRVYWKELPQTPFSFHDGRAGTQIYSHIKTVHNRVVGRLFPKRNSSAIRKGEGMLGSQKMSNVHHCLKLGSQKQRLRQGFLIVRHTEVVHSGETSKKAKEAGQRRGRG